MREKNGFTLVELVASLAIISLILLVAVPSVSSILTRYQDHEEAKKDKLAIKAVELYLIDTANLYQKITTQACYIKVSDIPKEYQIVDSNVYVFYDRDQMEYQISKEKINNYINCL